MAHALQSPVDLTDYLALEDASPVRHEYVGGYAHAMVGGSMRHNRISGNIYSVLLQRTASTPCQVFINDMKLHVQALDSVYYPDVFVLCGIGLAGERKVASDATLVVEVLSPSTSGTDRREKLTVYRKLPGLRSYWIVSQDERRVELHARSDDGHWAMSVLSASDDTLSAVGVPGAPLRLADLYVGTDVT